MFDWGILTHADRELAERYVGGAREEDYSFFPPNNVYQYRWYIVPRGAGRSTFELPNVYLHIMTGSDPTDELHDHDWHNTTHVLAGEAQEFYSNTPWLGGVCMVRKLTPGVVIYRSASEAHRLELPKGVPYLMTLFTIGPKIRSNKRWKLK